MVKLVNNGSVFPRWEKLNIIGNDENG